MAYCFHVKKMNINVCLMFLSKYFHCEVFGFLHLESHKLWHLFFSPQMNKCTVGNYVDPKEKREAIIQSTSKCFKALQIQDRAQTIYFIFSVCLASYSFFCPFLTSLETKHDYVLELQQHC